MIIITPGIALRLALNKANVMIVGRNVDAGREILSQMQALHPDGEHGFLPCDASMMTSIKAFCISYKKPIDCLILSQGIASIGYYFAHFIYCYLLFIF